MKLAVSADGNSLEATVDPRFGRCGYFIVVETDDLSFQAYANANAELPQSAGIQAASFVAATGVRGVLTGNCGPKAMDVLLAGDIQIFTGQSGTVREAVERFRNGTLPAAASRENVATGPRGGGRCGGKGMGSGRGLGGRCGLGGGRGMGQGAGNFLDVSPAKPPQTGTLAELKAQAAQLHKQMEAITLRIAQMEK
jgi:predicted Fe-Mo cluster-binding NifX family protein